MKDYVKKTVTSFGFLWKLIRKESVSGLRVDRSSVQEIPGVNRFDMSSTSGCSREFGLQPQPEGFVTLALWKAKQEERLRATFH